MILGSFFVPRCTSRDPEGRVASPRAAHPFNRRLKRPLFFAVESGGYLSHKKTQPLGLDLPVWYYLARYFFQGGICEAYRS